MRNAKEGENVNAEMKKKTKQASFKMKFASGIKQAPVH